MEPLDILSLLGGSFLFGSIFFWACLRFFPRFGLLDFPERYGLTRSPIPYPAGIAIISAFFISVLIFFPFATSMSTERLISVLVGLLVIAFVSFLDDRKQLSPVLRLSVQFLVACFLVYQDIYIEFLTNPTSSFAFHLPLWAGAFITIFWVVGCMNAINWLDGVPNLSVSSGALSSFVIGALSLSPLVNQPEIAVIAFCLGGCLLPFMIGNLGATRYILGDSGSMTIGFLLAVFSVFSGGKMATMLISMSMPVFDGLFVFFIRILRGKSPLKGKDQLHLHDQLVAKNWKNWQILLLYLVISLGLGISVLFLETIGKLLLIALFGTVFFAVRFWMLPSIDKSPSGSR